MSDLTHFDERGNARMVDVGDKDVTERVNKAVLFSDEVQQEDIAICETVQKNLHSRSYRRGRYSVKQEKGVHAFHRMYAEAMHI